MNTFSTTVKPTLLTWGLGAIMRTCRVRSDGMDWLRDLEKKGQPWIYCTWHNSSTVAVFQLRNRNIATMASASRDGEVIARIIEKLGNMPVRGSTSSGGSRAAREMVRAIRAGNCGGITPDGPRGPLYQCQPGALWVAALTGCPLVPYELDANPQWRLNSWDRHKIPKFFSTIYEFVGEPLYVSRNEMEKGGQELLERFQERMLENTRRCLEAAGHSEDIEQWRDKTVSSRT